MHPTKTRYSLVLCVTAIVEIIWWRALSAPTVANALSTPPLTVFPVTGLWPGNTQQHQRRRNSGDCVHTQVLRATSGTAARTFLGSGCGQKLKRKKRWYETAVIRVSCTDSVDSGIHSGSVTARVDGVKKGQIGSPRTAKDSRRRGPISIRVERNIASGQARDVVSEISRSRFGRANEPGPSEVAFRSSLDISDSTYADRGTTNKKTAGTGARGASSAFIQRSESVPSYVTRANKLPPPRAAQAVIDGSLKTSGRSRKLAEFAGVEATSSETSTGFYPARRPSAAFPPPSLCPSPGVSQTFQRPVGLLLTLHSSAAACCQQAFPFPCYSRLLFLCVARNSIHADPARFSVRLENERRYICGRGLPRHSWPVYYHNLLNSLRQEDAFVYSAASPVEVSLGVSRSPVSASSPAPSFHTGGPWTSHSCCRTLVPHGIANTSYVSPRFSCRLTASSAALTCAPPRAPIFLSTPCPDLFAFCTFSSAAACSRVVTTGSYSPSPALYPAHVRIPAGSSLITASSLPDEAQRQYSVLYNKFPRPVPSTLGSLLTPRVAQADRHSDQSEELKEKLDYIDALVKAIPVILFMKGTPTEPACGFSRMTYELLELAARQVNDGHMQADRQLSGTCLRSRSSDASASISSSPPTQSSLASMLSDNTFFRFINVLEDALMREGIKRYSEWPTIPQLYIRGSFVGGADITAAMYSDKSLHAALEKARTEMKAHPTRTL